MLRLRISSLESRELVFSLMRIVICLTRQRFCSGPDSFGFGSDSGGFGFGSDLRRPQRRVCRRHRRRAGDKQQEMNVLAFALQQKQSFIAAKRVGAVVVDFKPSSGGGASN